MAILSYESRFSHVMMQIAYGCYLNLLWVVCSLPIFTIGASTTALYYVACKIAKNEEGDITQQFFRSLRANFKQATLIWLIMLVAGLIIVADAILLYRLRVTSAGMLAVLWTLLLACVFACILVYVIVLT